MSTIIFLKILLFICSLSFLGILVNSIIQYICKNKDNSRLFNPPLFFVLGAGSYAFYETLFSICGIKSNIAHFVFLVCIFLLLNIILYRGKYKVKLAEPGSCIKDNERALPAILISFIIVVLLVISLVMTMTFPQFDIDMVGHILFKAKLFTLDTYKDSGFMHDGLFANVHGRYPPFVGMVFNLLFLFGCNTIACYQVINYFIFFLLGITIYLYLKGNIPLWQSLCWLFIFFSTKSYLTSQFIIDSTDILLSLSLLLAVLWIIEFHKRKDLYNLVICLVLVGFSTLIKNEALVFSIAAIFILTLLDRKASFKYIWIWFIIALPWLLYRYTLPEPDPTAEVIIKTSSPTAFGANLKDAWILIFPIILKQWNSAFILLVPAFIILYKSKLKTEGVIFFAVTAFLSLVYFSVISLHIDRATKIGEGLFRILSHVYPMALICIGLAAKQLMQKSDA